MDLNGEAMKSKQQPRRCRNIAGERTLGMEKKSESENAWLD